MTNSLATQKKILPLALGAVVEGAYLYAGADKGIEEEMQGKDNGDIIYYKTTDLGNPEFVDLSLDSDEGNGSGGDMSSTAVSHNVVPVTMFDSRIMYNVRAFEKQVTSIGSDLAYAKVGQKLAKKAVKEFISKDILTIGNVFVASGASAFEAFQQAGAYMKSIVDGTLYGFMDWQVWGALTGKGQQAVPCALAESRFGKNLVGSWSLIDQLRVIPDFEVRTGVACGAVASDGAVTLAKAAVTTAGVITITGTLPKGAMFTIDGVYAKDVNDMPTPKLFTFVTTNSVATGTPLTAANSNAYFGADKAGVNKIAFVAPEKAISATEVTPVLTVDKKYAATIIRADGAQAFGTMKTCDCEGAKYEKSSIDGINIHVNSGENVGAFKTDKRFDMIIASKLVEPRAACVIWYEL